MKIPIKVTYPAGQFGSTETSHFHFFLELPFCPELDKDEVLGNVFRMMNRVDGSPIEYLLNAFECRSLSVGDLVTFNKKTYRCDMVGWSEVA